MAGTATLSESERKERVSMLLRNTDEFIKKGDLEKALEIIRNVYQYDIQNMYARAFEERILMMIVERDGQVIQRKVADKEKHIQQEIEKKAQIEINKRLKEFYHQWEEESKRREDQEKKEIELELKAREAALLERQAEHEQTYQNLLDENRKREEMAARSTDGQESNKSHEVHIEKIKAEHEKQIAEVQQQALENEKVFSARELTRFRWRSIEVYKSILMTLDSSIAGLEELLKSIRGILDISDDENNELTRSVKIDAYIKALRKAYEGGTIKDEERQIINNLRNHYEISEEEHTKLVKQVKLDLGIPDEDAMILIIDDSPDILVFCDYALRKTYTNVKTALSVDVALETILLEMPSLIVCDVMMPDVSGFQFYDNIKNGKYGEPIKSVPFMFMSACDDDYMKRIASAQGISTYLTKPITKAALEEAVKQMLSKREPAAC
ncbi:MAG TPA: response regulator [Bacteroidota bacterium]|nr:response regulator [Bacteroidota bacterium]